MKKIYFLLLMLFALHSTQAQNTCASAISIAAIPFTSGTLTTCGTGNDYTAGSYFNTNYGAGEDYVFSINITTAPVTYKIALGGSATWKIASVHTACPPTAGNSIGGVATSSGSTGEAQVTFAANGTYYIIVDTWPTPACGEFTLSLTVPPPPPANDNSSGAVPLTMNADYNCTITTAGTTESATASPEGAATCSATGIDDDVWYSFVATGPLHRISFSGVTTGTMVAALYSGTPGSLTFITGACASTTLNATGLASGTTYYVRAYTTAASITQTAFNICVGTPPPPPANDEATGAVLLSVNAGYACGVTTAGTTISSTQSAEAAPTCSATGINDDVWFRFVATSAAHRISFSGVTTGTMVAALYSGTPGSLAFITGACASTTLNATGLTVSETYYVRAYTSVATATTQTNFNICVGTPPPPPANDDATGAVLLTVNADYACGVTTAGTTISSTQSAEAAPTCSATGINDDVWFRFVATSAAHRISFSGVTTGTMVAALYSGTPGSLAFITGACASTTLNATGLTVSETYYVRAYTSDATATTQTNFNICVGTPPPPPANDDAPGAITLTVNGTCAGGTYSNASATLGATEPRISCKGSLTAGSIVWFKFVAPPSGFVKVSTDISGGTLTDTRIALFSAADVNDYSTFSILACDDDNGSVVGASSIFYANGLLPSNTYYIAVDHWNGSSTGTFCVEVREFNSTMLSTATSCTAGQDLSSYRDNYTGWLSVTDNTGNLRALLRNPAGTGTSTYTFNNSMTINTGAVRQSSQTGTYYLDRNFRIANTAATNIDVQLFFLVTETAALTTADGTSLASLAVTRQTEVVSGCHPNFVAGNGVTSVIPQNTNGTLSGVDWIQFNTPAFSNFYLNKVGEVLPVSVEYFKGSKQNNGHLLDWKVTCYNSSSVTMLLERSADGRRFTSINNQTETSLRCLQPFSFTDAAPLAGINYYRLKSVDIDGKESFSKIVALLNKEKGFEIVSLVPNPVKDEAVLSVSSATKSIIEIVVSNLSGKQLNKQRVTMIAGNNLLPINVRNLPAGTYQVTGITADGMTRTLRFVKQ